MAHMMPDMRHQEISRFHNDSLWSVMAGLDPAIPLNMARPRLTIGIAGSSPAMTAWWFVSNFHLAAELDDPVGRDAEELGRGLGVAMHRREHRAPDAAEA
jgi:hypothetical protein